MATVTVHYARACLEGARRAGVDVDALIRAAGISDELLQVPSGRVLDSQLTRLIQLVWESLEDEFMGFTERRCKRGAFAMACRLLSQCETVDAMFEQGVEFYRLLTDDISMEYRHDGEQRQLSVSMRRPELDAEHFFLEFWLVIWHRLVSWFCAQPIPLLTAHFAYPRSDYASEFAYQFACPCKFNAEQTAIWFPAQYGNLKPSRSTGEIARLLKHSPADFMTIPGNENSISQQLHRHLIDAQNAGEAWPDSEAMAQKLGLSAQSMRRKLRREGNSFNRVRDGLRRDIAIEKLTTQNMAVADVAEQLGFAEPRSFSRAFRQWTGVPPGAYRR